MKSLKKVVPACQSSKTSREYLWHAAMAMSTFAPLASLSWSVCKFAHFDSDRRHRSHFFVVGISALRAVVSPGG